MRSTWSTDKTTASKQSIEKLLASKGSMFRAAHSRSTNCAPPNSELVTRLVHTCCLLWACALRLTNRCW